MHTGDEMPLIAPEAPMAEALIEMSRKGFGVVGVVDAAGALVGIVTDGDLRRHMAGAARAARRGGDDARRRGRSRRRRWPRRRSAVMNARKITTLFATEPDGAGRPAGILHVHDCLRAGVV